MSPSPGQHSVYQGHWEGRLQGMWTDRTVVVVVVWFCPHTIIIIIIILFTTTEYTIINLKWNNDTFGPSQNCNIK